MWSLELGASPEIAHSATIRRAHDLRAAAFAAALARIARPVAMIFRQRHSRSLLRKIAPVRTEGVFNARAHSIAAIGSAADIHEEPPQQVGTASLRLAPPADAEPPVLIERDGTVATLTLNRPERLNAISYAMVDRLQVLLDEMSRTTRYARCC